MGDGLENLAGSAVASSVPVSSLSIGASCTHTHMDYIVIHVINLKKPLYMLNMSVY